MAKRVLLLVVLFTLRAASAHADDNIPMCVKEHIPQATKAATAQASYMMFDLYTATLYKSSDAKETLTPPYAMQIDYHRSFNAADIVDRTISDIRDSGYHDEVKLAAWHERLGAIIPDVDTKTTLIGVLTSRNETLFYENGQFIGKVSDPTFGPAFFAVWLNKKSCEPLIWDTNYNQ
jgi:hypothetical protein